VATGFPRLLGEISWCGDCECVARANLSHKKEDIVKTKITTTALVALFGLALLLPTSSFAGRKGASKGEGKSYGKSSHVKLRAKLLPPSGITEEILGHAKYEKKSSNKGSEEKFDSHIKLPLPSSTLEIAAGDLNSLFNTTFLLKILGTSTTGTPPVTTMTEKGSCLLFLDKVEFDYEQGNVLEEVDAVYRADLKEKSKFLGTAELKKKIGDCDVVLSSTTPGAPADGIPDIAEGDIAEVYVLGQTSTGATPTVGALLLTGTFSSKHHGDDEDDDEDD